MAPFHEPLLPRQSASAVPSSNSSEEAEKWMRICVVLAGFSALCIGIMLALGRSYAIKCRQIRHLQIDFRRFNGEECITGQDGIVLREYEARSLPALKAKLEASQSENANLKDRLKISTQTLQDLKRECVGLSFRLEAAEEEKLEALHAFRRQNPSNLASPSASHPPSPTAMSPRTMDKGKEKDIALGPIRRKPVPAFVQSIERSTLRLSRSARNGDMRRRPIHIRHQTVAQSEAGSIEVVEDPFEESNSAYSAISPTSGFSRDQRDPLYFIDEVCGAPIASPRGKDGERSPLTSPLLQPTAHPASPKVVSRDNFTVDRDVDHRRSYTGYLRQQTNTVTSPGARSLPAMSPNTAKCDEVSLDD